MTTPPHTTHCTLGPPHPRTGDLPVYGPDGVDGPTLGVVVATNPRAAGDARLWAGAWRMLEELRRQVRAIDGVLALEDGREELRSHRRRLRARRDYLVGVITGECHADPV